MVGPNTGLGKAEHAKVSEPRQRVKRSYDDRKESGIITGKVQARQHGICDSAEIIEGIQCLRHPESRHSRKTRDVLLTIHRMPERVTRWSSVQQ